MTTLTRELDVLGVKFALTQSTGEQGRTLIDLQATPPDHFTKLVIQSLLLHFKTNHGFVIEPRIPSGNAAPEAIAAQRELKLSQAMSQGKMQLSTGNPHTNMAEYVFQKLAEVIQTHSNHHYKFFGISNDVHLEMQWNAKQHKHIPHLTVGTISGDVRPLVQLIHDQYMGIPGVQLIVQRDERKEQIDVTWQVNPSPQDASQAMLHESQIYRDVAGLCHAIQENGFEQVRDTLRKSAQPREKPLRNHSKAKRANPTPSRDMMENALFNLRPQTTALQALADSDVIALATALHRAVECQNLSVTRPNTPGVFAAALQGLIISDRHEEANAYPLPQPISDAALQLSAGEFSRTLYTETLRLQRQARRRD